MNLTTVQHLITAKHASTPKRLIKTLGLSLVLLVAALLPMAFNGDTSAASAFSIFAGAFLIIATIEMGSHTFNEYKQKNEAYRWLMLPASQLEKWSSSFLTSFLIVPVVYIAVFIAASIIANLLLLITGFDTSIELLNPFSDSVWNLIKGYWMIHPLFFFGAIYFKKQPILKISASIVIIIIMWAMYSVALANLLLADLVMAAKDSLQGVSPEVVTQQFSFLIFDEHGVQFVSNAFTKTVFYTLCIGYFTFFWGLSFLRFKELEL